MRLTKIVELGIGNGYSTTYLAKGLKEMHTLYNSSSKLDAYDLFEDYAYKHSTKVEIENIIKGQELEEFVNIYQGDAYEVHKNYADKSIEFLHVDLSNTGDTVHKIMELWHPKICERGFIAFEGGSEERDNVEWMVKYNKPSIKKAIDTNEIIKKYYVYGTYLRFPSLTVLFRNYDDYART
jgi:hypothetical protein